MGKIAFVFSGQGAQYSGMGKALYESSPAAKAVFDMADGIRPGTSRQCFEGSMEELTRTVNTQPCVFTADLAAARALLEAGVQPDCAAGFSLGEIAALAFAGVLSDEDAFKLVCRRGELMDKAAKENPGAMAAVMKLPPETVEEAVKKAGGRAKLLPVSGAFHSPFMADAAAGLAEYIRDVGFADPKIPVYSDFTAKPYEGDYRELVRAQVESPVRWQSIIEDMAAQGVDTFIEVGVGKTLQGLIKRILPDAEALKCETPEEAQAICGACRAE